MYRDVLFPINLTIAKCKPNKNKRDRETGDEVYKMRSDRCCYILKVKEALAYTLPRSPLPSLVVLTSL